MVFSDGSILKFYVVFILVSITRLHGVCFRMFLLRFSINSSFLPPNPSKQSGRHQIKMSMSDVYKKNGTLKDGNSIQGDERPDN